MTRTSLKRYHCSWARAADILGDKWALLIIRDAMGGVTTFSEFQRNSGATAKVLSDRLQRLIENGILEKRPVRPGVDRYTYTLTEQGRALFPMMMALGQWGDQWIFGSGGEPVRILDRKTGNPVQPISVTARDGRDLEIDDVVYAPGPGASRLVKSRFGQQ